MTATSSPFLASSKMSLKSDSSCDNSSMSHSTADELEKVLMEDMKAARHRRKHHRHSHSSSHSGSDMSSELQLDSTLCRELHFDDDMNDSGLGNSTLHSFSFSPGFHAQGMRF